MDPTKMKGAWRELLISKFVNRVWWIYEQRSDLLEATSIVIIFVYYACNLHEKKESYYATDFSFIYLDYTNNHKWIETIWCLHGTVLRPHTATPSIHA